MVKNLLQIISSVLPFRTVARNPQEVLRLLDVSSEIEDKAAKKMSELRKEKSLAPIVKQIGDDNLEAMLKFYYWLCLKKEEWKKGGHPHCPRPDFKKEVRSMAKALDSLRRKELIKDDSLTKIGYILIDDLSHNPQELAWRMADLSKKSWNGRPKEIHTDYLLQELISSLKKGGRIDWKPVADLVWEIDPSMKRYDDLADNLRQRHERHKKNSSRR